MKSQLAVGGWQLAVYILVCAYLFALLDWKVVQYTRLKNPAWLGWMHAHERAYANVTRTLELALCAPAIPLKPIFYHAFLYVEASAEEQAAITHAPRVDWRGFYHLPVRGQSWTFVSWAAWLVYWLVPSLAWLWLIKRFV